MSGFDSYAHDYDTALNRGIAVSGEDKTFFAKGRILWLSRCLKKLGFAPRTVLDYGCGTGTATPFLIDTLGADSVVGVDLSGKSLDVARQTHSELAVDYKLISDYDPNASVDLAFCNGVFHHIAPQDRPEITRWIGRCLRPGGIFALWENNPWNPGTRYIMSRIPFDRDAVLLNALEVRAMMRQAGFDVSCTDYYFIFPHAARFFRPLEPFLANLPLGAQYQVLGRKPG